MLEINRREERHVVDVSAALVRIVHHDHVAFENIFDTELLDNRLGTEFHRRKMNRAVCGLAQQLRVGVVDGIREIHHISQKMVTDKPTIKQVLPAFLKFIGNHIIVGHGISFDIQVIANSAEREGIETNIVKNKTVDTLRLARLYGESPTNSLEQLRKHFNIEGEIAHRAMSDVRVNIEVFKYLVKNFSTTEKLFQVLSKPILLKEMPLGKHKGRPLKEVPIEYLRWAVNKDFDMDLSYSIKMELKRRKKGGLFSQAGNPFQEL